MRRSEARKLVAAYVQDRLERECGAKRGQQTAIARATGFTRGHVNNVIKGQAGVGEDFAEKIAEYWGMTYDDLQRQAEEWSNERGMPSAPSQSPGRRFRDRTQWQEAVEAARSFYRHIPDEYFDRAGSFYDDAKQYIDAQFVGDLARILYEVDLREGGGPPNSVTSVTQRSYARDKKTSKS